MRCLRTRLSFLPVEAENDKECVATLEKSLQVEKDFSKLKDKQIGDLQFKLEKASPDAIQEFKEFDLYSDDLCEYYVEGFELFRRWMAKHHPELNLSGLVMGEVEKEFVADRPSKVTEENVVEETTIVALVDLSPSNLARQ